LIPIDKTNGIYQPATDGTNVYLGSQPGYSCPASDYGQNCTKTQVGWGGFIPTTIAAADGNIWAGFSIRPKKGNPARITPPIVFQLN
jgi:hypothetical protein